MPSASGPNRSSFPFRLPNRYVSDRRPQRRRTSVASYCASSSMPTSPPLPAAVIAWVRAKLVTLMSARVPVRVPRSHESSTSQLSSMTGTPCASAIWRMRSQSGQLPTRLGARMPFVRGPIISSILSTSIWYVSGSTSTIAGRIPDCTIGAMSAENVTTGVTMSSPGSHPSRSMARRSAEVPEFTITPWRFASSSRDRVLELLDASVRGRAWSCAGPRRSPRSHARRGRRRPRSPCGRSRARLPPPSADWSDRS